MYTIKWNNKSYKLIDSLDLTKSSTEVSYSDATVDFSDCSYDDLPYAQQEIEIYDNNNNLKYMGYVDKYKLPELKKVELPTKTLTLTLLSPRQLATKRTVTIMRTDTVENLIRQALEPLFSEGFYIKEINISRQVSTVNLISRTVEETMNYFSKRFSLYWNIDEKKGITVNSIQYQFSQNPKKEINIKNYTKQINGFISITPEIATLDYGNIINVKNARIFYNMDIAMDITLKNGDTLDFENPIDISTDTTKRIYDTLYVDGSTVLGTPLILEYDGKTAEINNTLTYNIPDKQSFKDISKNDCDNKLFTLTMDSTFKNLATSIKYNGENDIHITRITSDSALRYANVKLYNWNEINKMKSVITKSGQIEKILDVDSSWFTESEVVDYIRNYFGINDRYSNSITIEYDEINNINVGDRLLINLPEYFCDGDYVITEIKENIVNNGYTTYSVTAQNTSIADNYIDLFRSNVDTDENSSQTEVEYVCEYINEEIKETHTVELSDNNRKHTLNFTMNR